MCISSEEREKDNTIIDRIVDSDISATDSKFMVLVPGEGGGSARDPVFSSPSLVPSQESLKRLRWTSLFRISSLP